MEKKYIIELENTPFSNTDGDVLYRVKGFKSLVFDENGLKMLKPYGEMQSYKDGANDTWNLVKGLFYGNITGVDMMQMFGTTYLSEILDKYFPFEISEKIAVHKNKREIKDQEIKIGDEVKEKGDGAPFVVTFIKDNIFVHGLFHNGMIVTASLASCKKTGRHFDNISDFLNEVKE